MLLPVMIRVKINLETIKINGFVSGRTAIFFYTKDSKKYVSEGGTVYATSCLKGKCYGQKLKDIIDFYNLEKFDK